MRFGQVLEALLQRGHAGGQRVLLHGVRRVGNVRAETLVEARHVLQVVRADEIRSAQGAHGALRTAQATGDGLGKLLHGGSAVGGQLL